MKFQEITSRLTGFSTPNFGGQWNPPESQRAVARRVIAFLEDRRVLFVPSEMGSPDHCVQSILRIRALLTQELGELDSDQPLAQSLRAMRAACRKCLATAEADDRRITQVGAHQNRYASWIFNGAIGELRGVFGIHFATLAASYGLDVEGDLASILPAAVTDRWA